MLLSAAQRLNFLAVAARSVLLPGAIAAMAIFSAGSASAQSNSPLYWNKTTTADWGSTANWWTTAAGTTNPASVPGATNDAVFNGTITNANEIVTLSAGQSALGLYFNNTGTTLLDSINTTTQTLTLGTDGITVNSGAGAVTLGNGTNALNLTLGGAQSWTNNSSSLLTVVNAVDNGGFLLAVAGTGNTTINGAIGGNGGLTMSGFGTLTLTAANTFTGTTTVNSGALSLTGSLTSSSLTMGGGSFSFSKAGTNTQSFTSTLISSGGTAIKSTVSTDTLSLGSLTQTSGSGGTVKFTTTGAINTSTVDATGVGMIGGWAVIDNGNSTYSWAHSGTSGTNNITAATTTTTASSTANWAPSGAQTINSTTVNSLIESADVKLNSNQTLTIGSGGIIFQSNSFWMQPATGSDTTTSVTSGSASGELFVFTPNTALTDQQIRVNIVDNGAVKTILAKDGPGTLILGTIGTNTYTGGTDINGGVLQLSAAGALGPSGAIRFGGGTLQYTASNTTDYSSRFSTAANQAFSINTNGQTVTWATALTSSGGSLAKAGTGTLILTPNTGSYTGGTTINAGELQPRFSSATPLTVTNLGTGPIALNGGTLHFNPSGNTGTSYTYANNFVLNGGTLYSEDGNLLLGTSSNSITVSGATTLQRQWGYNTTSTTGPTKGLQINGLLQGSANLTLQGIGGNSAEGGVALINNASNTYSGTINVTGNSGTAGFALVDGASNALQFATVNPTGSGTGNLAFTLQFASGVTAPIVGALSGSSNIKLQDNTSTNGPGPAGAAVALTVGSNNGTTAYSGALSGTGSLTKAGSGTMSLSGTNGYTGTTTVSTGTLQLAVPAALYGGTTASWTPANITINNGATLAVNYGAVSGDFSSAQIGTLLSNLSTVNNNGLKAGASFGFDTTNLSGTYSTAIADSTGTGGGAVGVAKLGTNTLTLSAANTYTGPTTIYNGVLSLNHASALGGGGNVVFKGGTLQYTSNNTADYSAKIASSTSAITIDTNSQTITYASPLVSSNNAGLTLNDSNATKGTLLLTGANAYTGTTTITSGTLQIGGAGTLGAGSYAGSIVDGTSFIYNSSAPQTLSGVISGAGSLTQNGAGTLTLSNFNTYTGGTIVNAGILNLTAGNNGTGAIRGTLTINTGGKVTLNQHDVFGYTSTATTLTTLNIAGGTLDKADATANETLTGVVTNLTGGTWSSTGGGIFDLFYNAYGSNSTAINSLASSTTSLISAGLNFRSFSPTITVAAGTTPSGVDLLVSGVLQSNPAGQGFTKAGPGVMAVIATNTYNGTTVISAGTLRVGNGGTTGTLGTGAVTDNATLAFNRTNAMTVANAITGSGAVVQSGTGTTTLSGTNGYAGTTTMSTGTLQFAVPAALYGGTTASWTPTNITVASGATLAVNFGGASDFTGVQVGTLLSNLSAVSSNGLLAGSSFGFDTTNLSGSYSTIITNSTGTGGGAVGIVKLGANTLTLGSGNTYSGPTSITTARCPSPRSIASLAVYRRVAWALRRPCPMARSASARSPIAAR